MGQQGHSSNITQIGTNQISISRDGFALYTAVLGLEAAVAAGAMGRFFELCEDYLRNVNRLSENGESKEMVKYL